MAVVWRRRPTVGAGRGDEAWALYVAHGRCDTLCDVAGWWDIGRIGGLWCCWSFGPVSDRWGEERAQRVARCGRRGVKRDIGCRRAVIHSGWSRADRGCCAERSILTSRNRAALLLWYLGAPARRVPVAGEAATGILCGVVVSRAMWADVGQVRRGAADHGKGVWGKRGCVPWSGFAAVALWMGKRYPPPRL